MQAARVEQLQSRQIDDQMHGMTRLRGVKLSLEQSRRSPIELAAELEDQRVRSALPGDHELACREFTSNGVCTLTGLNQLVLVTGPGASHFEQRSRRTGKRISATARLRGPSATG